MEKVSIGDQYILHDKIGAGSFGEIYTGEDKSTFKQVAVKLEDKSIMIPQLEIEAKLYKKMSGGVGIPKFHYYGTTSTHNVLVIDLLGKSIEKLFVENKSLFSLKTVLMLADQMISCVQYIHHHNYLHRDIKPDNFMMGTGKASGQVFIIDYGLAKQYRDPDTQIHIKQQQGKTMTGTARYASLNAMRGSEQSRRDDLESLGYIFVYLLKGQLPWQGLPAGDPTQKLRRIYDCKRKTTIEALCSDVPAQFADYLRKVRRLAFDEEPKYAEYKSMFRQLLNFSGFIYDCRYDWVEQYVPEVKFVVRPPNEPRRSIPRRFRNWNYTPRRDNLIQTGKHETRLCVTGTTRHGTCNLPKINRPQVPQKIYTQRKNIQHNEWVE